MPAATVPTDSAIDPITANSDAPPPMIGCDQIASIDPRHASKPPDLPAAAIRIPVPTPATASQLVHAAPKTNIAIRQTAAATPLWSRTHQATASATSGNNAICA